jgi:hypothetical protein
MEPVDHRTRGLEGRVGQGDAHEDPVGHGDLEDDRERIHDAP